MTDERDPDANEAASGASHASHGAAVRDVTVKVASGAAAVAGAVVDAADDLVDRVRPTAEHLASAAIGRASPRRLRRYRIHRRATPLPNLYAVHPEARTAPVRELGLEPIAVDEIVGTAVEGIAQRGLDFQPLPEFRSKNWEARWQRIVRAVERLQPLPPIDVLKTAEGFWVTDGHNRVAAAKVVGQVAIDADVRAVLLPGQPVPRPATSLAAVLAESAQIEAAGTGRLTRGTTLGRTIQSRDVTPHAADGAADPRTDGREPGSGT